MTGAYELVAGLEVHVGEDPGFERGAQAQEARRLGGTARDDLHDARAHDVGIRLRGVIDDVRDELRNLP